MKTLGTGLPAYLRHKSQTAGHNGGRTANGLLLRGVVVAVRDPDASTLTTATLFGFRPLTGIVCDVVIIDEHWHTKLVNVPIMKSSAGLNDREDWRPRAASQEVTTGAVVPVIDNGTGELNIPVTNLDGDLVIIGFMADDLDNPVILGQLDHPLSLRKPDLLDPIKPKYRRYIQGNKIEVVDGNVNVDLSLASLGLLNGPLGAEVPAPGIYPLPGNLNIALGPLSKISIGTAIAPSVTAEPVILGRTFLTQLQASLTEIQAAFSGLGIPLPTTAATIASISTSLAAGRPFLSTKLDTD